MKLVLLPGAGCSRKFYDEVIQKLSKKFNVEIIDYSGKTLDENVEDLLKKLVEIKEKYILVAHCFSGLLAIKILSCIKLPYLISLVLCNCTADFTHLSADFVAKDNGEHIEDYSDFPTVVRAKKYLLPDDITETQIIIACNTNLSHLLKSISVPTLVIGSNKDGYFSEELYIKTARQIKNSKLVIIQDAKHLGLLTNTNEYLKVIYEFTKNI